MRRTRLILATSTKLLMSLLFAVLSVSVGAQAASESHAGEGFGPAYNVANETMLTGTIQKVVNKQEAADAAGVHLLVTGPQDVVDVHVGPFLSKEAKAALLPGVPVQIIGATMQSHDKECLLAREVTVGSRTITIRNAKGFLVYAHSDRAVKAVKSVRTEVTGGAQ